MSKSRSRGFTIIEVVLVLAIAGLIFLMVFIALPALQRGQRNTQRKNDLSRIVTAVSSYQANNSNKLPFKTIGTYKLGNNSTDTEKEINPFVQRYIIAGGDNAQFQDPDGESYIMAYGGNFNANDNTSPFGNSNGVLMFLKAPTESSTDVKDKTYDTSNLPFNHYIYVATQAKCGSSEGTLSKGSGKNDFALMYVLEGGSATCADNQ
ncbi:type II secretion system protein [Candidatus Saccharibacteria bacterium]|nr:type II secretion system protein [Candidatus Saccharibacteria bacterium]